MKTSPVKNCETACGERYVADVPVAEHLVGRGRVVEQCLHLALEVVPGADRVVVHRRAGGRCTSDAARRGTDGNHSTRWRTTSRAAQPSTGDGSSHWSGRTPATTSPNRPPIITELLCRCVGHVGQTRSVRRDSSLSCRPAVARLVMNRHTRPCAEQHQQDQQDRLGLDGLQVEPPADLRHHADHGNECVEDDRDHPVERCRRRPTAGCAAAPAGWPAGRSPRSTTKLTRQIVVVPVPPTWAKSPISAGKQERQVDTADRRPRRGVAHPVRVGLEEFHQSPTHREARG